MSISPSRVGLQSLTSTLPRVQFLEVPGDIWAHKPWSLPKTRTYVHPYSQAPLQALRDVPAPSSCMHPCVPAHADCFQAHCSSCEPFSLHLLCPHLQKLPLNSPHLFQKSKVLKESLLGLQSPGTFYLGQEARGNHVILADKAIMRPGCGSKGMKCS